MDRPVRRIAGRTVSTAPPARSATRNAGISANSGSPGRHDAHMGGTPPAGLHHTREPAAPGTDRGASWGAAATRAPSARTPSRQGVEVPLQDHRRRHGVIGGVGAQQPLGFHAGSAFVYEFDL